MEKHNSRRAAADPATRTSSRSRSREREEQPPQRQLRSITRDAAAIQVAYANHPRSISRLHDDELLCVLRFLALADLAELVCCSRRFNGVARKERSRELQHSSSAAHVPSLVSSPLGHHISSLWFERHRKAESALTLTTLRHLRSLPQLTDLQLRLFRDADAVALLRRLTLENAVTKLQAVLPTQLRCFVLLMRSNVPVGEPIAHSRRLFSSVFAALPAMPQLTELHIGYSNFTVAVEVRLDALARLPQLRLLGLSLTMIDWTDERIADLKPLSQLRELHTNLTSTALIKLCQPPHSLQLECIGLDHIRVDRSVMRALLHLPTLTDLQPDSLLPAAWPLLPQLPLLRRLAVTPCFALTAAQTTSLSVSLSGCRALTQLSLGGIAFEDDDGDNATEEQQQACWTEILRTVPLLRRLTAGTRQGLSFLAALPSQLPQLVCLLFLTFSSSSAVLLRLAHPTVQELEVVTTDLVDEAQVRALVRSPQLPQLVNCKFHQRSRAPVE
jgi:hypothetical protein